MGERIYTAEDAEALAAKAAGCGLSGDWYRVEVPGGDSIDGPDGSMDPTSDVACEGELVARCEFTDVAVLVASAPGLARSVAHHARRAEALEAEVRRLRSVIASVEMIAVPDDTGGEDHKCPFCGRVKWWIDSPERWRFHEAGCAWVAAQEVTRG